MDKNSSALGFSNAPGIGPKSFLKLLKIYGNSKNAWEESSAEKFRTAGVRESTCKKFEEFKRTFEVDTYSIKMKNAKVAFISYESDYYPANLREIDSPPIGLFIKGNVELLTKPNLIGVVGARKITSYGKEVTEKLTSELCSQNFTIVSGMALGVDGIAHKAAIDNKGLTIAVLGCGVDCPYPRENEKLYEEILDKDGLIISEYPLGMSAAKGTFPARNRIIAGISSAVLITEAAEDSGSLITAALALKQGKKVFAVPGQITSQMSRGSLKLIKQGAVMVSSAKDILDELNIKSQAPYSKQNNNSKFSKLSKSEKMILEVLLNEEMTIDEIAKVTEIKIGNLSMILSKMELAGLIKNFGGKISPN